MSRLGRAIGIGTALQILMVVLGHFAPGAQQVGLFPIVGTLIGVVTGWLSGSAGTVSRAAGRGAAAAGIAGVLGSLVSTALGDVPLGNFVIAGTSTLVAGAVGALIRRRMAFFPAATAQTAWVDVARYCAAAVTWRPSPPQRSPCRLAPSHSWSPPGHRAGRFRPCWGTTWRAVHKPWSHCP
jgi:hypothetical protein